MTRPVIGCDIQEQLRMDPPTFWELYDRYASNEVTIHGSVQLGKPHHNPDAQNVLTYLSSFGFRVATLDELFQAIDGLQGEEELAAFRCQEGVAVSHASDGWWLLFEAPSSND